MSPEESFSDAHVRVWRPILNRLRRRRISSCAPASNANRVSHMGPYGFAHEQWDGTFAVFAAYQTKRPPLFEGIDEAQAVHAVALGVCPPRGGCHGEEG